MIIVGGLPKPIGGVTSFLKRLVLNCDISLFIDLYPHNEKNIPSKLIDRYVCFHKLYLLWFLSFKLDKSSEVFFNFSRPISLLLFIFFRKRKQKWLLMLHHGDLQKNLFFKFLLPILLKKFDSIYCLNNRQYTFYSKYVDSHRLVISSSYIPLKEDEGYFSEPYLGFINNIREKYKYIFCCSGYPTSIYRHEWSINSVLSRKDSAIILCIYGEGNIHQLKGKFSSYENVFFLYYLEEDDFNFILKNTDCYLRPNAVDSFGVAVADAINFGVCVIASDVCSRYKGAILFNSNSEEAFVELVQSFPYFDTSRLFISEEDIKQFNF